jgi:dienelactone hydrolase
MASLTRRELLLLGLAASAGLGPLDGVPPDDVHQQLLRLADRCERERRARFAAVASGAELEALQDSLRRTFFRLIGGLPAKSGDPRVVKTGRIESDNYFVEKLAYESFPGYHVTALLYRPTTITAPVPGILSPCGHSEVGKAAEPYQTLHINLARRGFVVLTYDPVGQAERSQFWDAARGRSRFDLACGEHAVLGNPLYLLGSNLARFRIWDGMRGIDYLTSLPEVDPKRVGCVGNSGGGNLTAYITALDPRVTAAAICCYITTQPRRMRNRIQDDPSADPEQDVFGFLSEGIDHAGLLALCAPRPTLLGTARFDFFPIEGARESFDEAKRLYTVAGAADRIARVEAPEKHGLSLVIREAVYGWFGRWLADRDDPAGAREMPVRPRTADELRVSADGQVNRAFRSRPLLPLALEEFRRTAAPQRKTLAELLHLDPDRATPRVTEIAEGPAEALVILINGNEAPDWREQPQLLRALGGAGHAIAVVDPRGAGARRLNLTTRRGSYADPISGVEENVAYNAFLVGESLLGLRVSDVVSAVRGLAVRRRPRRILLCGRCDSALVACFAAAVEPAVNGVAVEEMLCSVLPLFSAEGYALNAASVLPGLLRDFGDIPEVLAQVAPRRVLIAAGIGDGPGRLPSIRVTPERFTPNPTILTDWLREG